MNSNNHHAPGEQGDLYIVLPLLFNFRHSYGDSAVYGRLLEIEPLHAILDIPLGLLRPCEIYLPGLGVRKVLSVLGMPDEDVFLDLRLLDQPLLGVGSLHQSFMMCTHQIHLTKGTDDMHPQPCLPRKLLPLLDYLKAPSLVHTHVASVNDDLPLALPSSVGQIQALPLIIGEDKDGVLEPVDIEHARTVQPEQLAVLPLTKLRCLQHPLQAKDGPRVILDPHVAVSPRNDLKFLVLFQ